MIVYGDTQSGNCYKVKLLLSLLGIARDWQHIDILNGETRTEAFLQKNPQGQIPLVELDDGRYLAESNAILGYFAEGTPYLPTDRYQKARVYQWLFFEQYSHEPYVAVARFIVKYLGMPVERQAEHAAILPKGYAALRLMDQQLQQTAYLAGDQLSIADIALYAYSHVAHEGGFALADFAGLQGWFARIQAQPGYVGMD